MLSIKAVIHRIRRAVHDDEQRINYSDGEILDVINAGLRMIRRTIADIQPEILMKTATGILEAGQDEIHLKFRPLMIVEVTAGDKVLSKTEGYANKKIFHNRDKICGNKTLILCKIKLTCAFQCAKVNYVRILHSTRNASQLISFVRYCKRSRVFGQAQGSVFIMTDDERKILEAELYKLSPTAQAILKKILTPAEIEILDEKHQRFNGKIYTQTKDGHYRHDSLLHRDVWEYFNGEIPRGYVIHHRNVNKFDNRIANLQILTNSEHRKLHNELTSKQPFKICPVCGKEFYVTNAAAFWGRKYCSVECANKAYTEKYTCIYCGKEFLSDKFNDRKFCSISCASKYTWEREKRAGKNRNDDRPRDDKGRFVSEKK